LAVGGEGAEDLVGGLGSFQVCTKCGWSPNARQIREIADWLIPVAAAIDRVDQCVSCPGPQGGSAPSPAGMRIGRRVEDQVSII
jgi:hypothetical protein